MSQVFRKLVILFWSLLASQAFSTNSAQIESLLQSERRPTIIEVGSVMADFGPEFPQPIPAGAGAPHIDKRLNVRHWTSLLLDTAAEIIPIFESTYPGANWVFIGRDADALADVFESFYRSIGQKKRVYRFAASSGSFQNVSLETILGYVSHIGLDIKKAIRGAPIVFVDSISKGGGRQARTILSMIYSYLLDSTAITDVLDIAKKINFMGLRVSTTGNFQSEPPEAAELAQRNLEKILLVSRTIPDQNQRASFIFSNMPVVALPESPYDANEAGYTHFIGAWHQSYRHFTPEGIPKIGAPYGRELRESILWTQWQVIEGVKDEKFLSRMRKSSKRLGYHFDKLFLDPECQGPFK